MIARLILTLVLVALGCTPTGSTWEPFDDGLAGYALPTGVAVGPIGTVYVAMYREGAVSIARPGEVFRPGTGLERVAGYDVAASLFDRGVAVAATTGGIYRTTDDGRTWRRVGDGRPAYSVLFDREFVYASRDGALDRSSDGGATWLPFAALPADLTPLAILRSHDDLMIGTNRGIWRVGMTGIANVEYQVDRVVSSLAVDRRGILLARSEGDLIDRRSGWQPLGRPATSAVLGVATAGSSIIAATERDGVQQSTDGGFSWRPLGTWTEGTVYAVAYADEPVAATSGGVYRYDGTSWQTVASGYGKPLVRALAADDRLWAGTSDGVYRHDGRRWVRESGALRDILTLSVLPAGDTILAGTWEAGVVKSDDAGKSWETVTSFEYSRAIIPALNRHDTTIVARVEYDRTLVSVEGGDAWRLVDGGLEGRTVFALASGGGVQYAGTDSGLFRLVGASWEQLPDTAGTGINAVAATTFGLFAGTAAGVWRADGGWRRDGLADSGITALLAAPDDRLIAATSDSGVAVRTAGGWRIIGPAGRRINAVAIEPGTGALVAATETAVLRRLRW